MKSSGHSATLVIIADGWQRSVFLDMLENQELPEIQKYIIDQGGILSNVVSNLPSVSIASHMSIIGNCYQDEHLIPGHRWYDRENGRIYSYLKMNGPMMANQHISDGVDTIFESEHYERAISIQGVISRGADAKSSLLTLSGVDILRKTADVLVENRRRNVVVVSWLPLVDSLAHIYGPHSKKVRQEMKNTSKAFGRLAEKLTSAGIFEQLKVVFVPDHGQRAVSGRANLRAIFAMNGIPAALNPTKPAIGKQIILTSGDSSAQVYFTPEYIGSRHDIACNLCNSPEIELVCWYDEEVWSFVNKLGASVSSWTNKSERMAKYEVTSGDDPLGLTKEPMSIFNLSAPQIQTGKYPDILHQIMRSYVPGRSGDMLIFPSCAYHFGSAPRFGWRLGYHRGSHGGPHFDEVMVAVPYKGFDIDDRPIRSAELLRVLQLI